MTKSSKKRKANHSLFHAMKAQRAAAAASKEQHTDKAVTKEAPILSEDDEVAAAVTPITNTTTPTVVHQDIPGISESDLAITVQTIQALVAQPKLFHGKPCKELRRILHPLVLLQLQSYDKGIDYRHKVTSALKAQKWSDALSYLQACHDFAQYAKQGTIQRWVRDCDMAATSSSMGSSCQLSLLSAILRLGQHPEEQGDVDTHFNQHDAGEALARALGRSTDVQPTMTNAKGGEGGLSSSTLQLLTVLKGWKWWNPFDDPETSEESSQEADHGAEEAVPGPTERGENKEGTPAKDSTTTNNNNDNDMIDPALAERLKYRILYQEAAAERKPPNHYDLILHTTTEPGAIVWTHQDQRPVITKHDVPFLTPHSSSFVLANVLTSEECRQLRQAATCLGFRPDHPTALSKPTGIDSCEWFVDSSIGAELFQRVQPHLPATPAISSLASKTKRTVSVAPPRLHSINNRWRCFRYDSHCVYRPHLDGSWPESGMDEEGNYTCDTTGQTKSYWTFLIYLNDNFEGGETRFYLPNNATMGGGGDSVMVARGVVPKEGSVLIFPQGNSASLIHEGSAVSRGVKYVIRSDVLYTTRPEGDTVNAPVVEDSKEKDDSDDDEEEE
jgi:hypothetical protein